MKHLIGLLALFAAMAAHADAVEQLRAFVKNTHSGRASFEQTVTAPDGAKRKSSSGSFEFARPNRFRFDYLKPYPQLIVADGEKVWMHDPDLNQVTVRRFDQALGASPAALLAGDHLERDFSLSAQPAQGGLDWVRATPKAAESGFQWMAVGFDGGVLAAVEILDSFGQRTLLKMQRFEPGVALPAERFRFTPPPGADLLQQ